MAGSNTGMSTIIQLLATLDDASWETLASKGLVRRAQKEVSKGIQVETISDTPFALTLKVGDLTIVVPADGPAKATCSCGASGCCHHIVAAGLFFRTSPLPEVKTSAPGAENELPVAEAATDPAKVLDPLLALDYSVLKRWCGVAAWRVMLRLLGSGLSPEVTVLPAAIVVVLKPMDTVPGHALDSYAINFHDVSVNRYIRAFQFFNPRAMIVAFDQIVITGTKAECSRKFCCPIADPPNLFLGLYAEMHIEIK